MRNLCALRNPQKSRSASALIEGPSMYMYMYTMLKHAFIEIFSNLIDLMNFL